MAEPVAAIGGAIAGLAAVGVHRARRKVGRRMNADTRLHQPFVTGGDVVHLKREMGVTKSVDAPVRVLWLRPRLLIFEHLDMRVANEAHELISRAAGQADDGIDEGIVAPAERRNLLHSAEQRSEENTSETQSIMRNS